MPSPYLQDNIMDFYPYWPSDADDENDYFDEVA